MCDHKEFTVSAMAERLWDTEDGDEIICIMAYFEVKCKECGLPFEFTGMPPGMSTLQPTTSPDKTQARCPLQPSRDVVHEITKFLNEGG